MANLPLEEFRAQLAHRYRIERELGHGGMATVYLARDLKLGRAVALKVLRPEVASVLGEDRFKREIELAAPLTHPNILPFIDSDHAAGRLFYVMPYVEGGTLADRLARGPPPAVAEALEITRQVAAGLTYAHGLGVVHRDIKPANILLATGHAWIADFGIARMIHQAMTTGEHLTDTGFAIGTPEYMAPEQLRGASQVDGRADEFSLACVLFEMLAGKPPPTNSGKPGVVRQLLRDTRHDLPPHLDTTLERALALDTDARFPTVAEFGAALAGMAPATRPRSYAIPRTGVIGLTGMTIVLVGILIWLVIPKHDNNPPGAAVDTTRYLILPFDRQTGVDTTLNEEDRLYDALTRWSGLTVVDQRQVREAAARRGKGALSSQDAIAVARELQAGRYLRGEVSRLGDSLRVKVTLFDVQTGGAQLQNAFEKLPRSSTAPAESLFTGLADRLLLRGLPPAGDRASAGTTSLPAWQAFVRGQTALSEWDLPAAESAFVSAGRADAEFASTQVWLALTRFWAGEELARWRYVAEQAATRRDKLGDRDRRISDALSAQAHGDLGRACPLWRDIASHAPADFVGWFSAATCQRGDTVVLRDPRSPSRWSFRSSFHRAFRDYQRAFELRPAVIAAFQPGSYESLRFLFQTDPGQRRSGRAGGDSTPFVAWPAWEADTLAYVPWPKDSVLRPGSTVRPSTVSLATRRQRELVRDIAGTWVAAQPGRPEALQALAVALQLLGNPAALDTLRRAGELAKDPSTRLSIAGAMAWMQLQLGAPREIARVEAARRMADSLLRSPAVSPADSGVLARLAMLTGRALLAAKLIQPAAPAEGWGAAPPLGAATSALLTLSALGGPPDSVLSLEETVTSKIERLVPEPDREPMRLQWLARSATVAFPDLEMRSLTGLRGRGDWFLDGLSDFVRRDSARARLMVHRIRTGQKADPGPRAWEAVYPEAALMAALGDREAAIDWLEAGLGDLGGQGPTLYAMPPAPGALVRAMVLRAELARQAGDAPNARRWATVVAILWSDADPFLQPAVARMRAIAGQTTVPKPSQQPTPMP